MAPTQTPTPPQTGFLDDFDAAVQRVRGALTELLLGSGARSLAAKDLGRRLDLSTNLAWKLSNLVRTSESWEVMPYLPGETALRAFFDAAKRAGSTPESIEAVRSELRGLDAVVERHAGSKAEFERLLSSSLAGHAPASQIETSRKLSFEGNCATWGVQARAQVAVQILAPNASDPMRVDIAQVSGLHSFRRLRPDVRWPLVRFQWDLDDERMAKVEPLDPAGRQAGALPWLRAFTTEPPPQIEARAVQSGTVYEISEGPAGLTSELDGLVGTVMRDYAPAFATQADKSAALFMSLSTPVELAVLEVYVHRAIAFPSLPTAELSSRMELGADGAGSPRRGSLLPLSESVEPLGSGPPVFALPDVPRHAEMLRAAFKHLGANPNEFIGYRIALRYPPIPTNLIMNCAIPTR